MKHYSNGKYKILKEFHLWAKSYSESEGLKLKRILEKALLFSKDNFSQWETEKQRYRFNQVQVKFANSQLEIPMKFLMFAQLRKSINKKEEISKTITIALQYALENKDKWTNG